jgi:hypothetical protein
VVEVVKEGAGERVTEGAAEPLRDAEPQRDTVGDAEALRENEGAEEGLIEAEQDATSRMEPGPQHAQEAHGMGWELPNGQ